MVGFSTFDHECMTKALRLAERGLSSTDPNPRVGCVMASGERIIGQGWHRRAGQAHAEIHALREAGSEARGSTAYVTLEPCSYQGRTASCANALIKAGVSRVVVATRDPNPRVDGAGFKMLEDSGIQVETGLLEKESEELNRGFSTRMRLGRPWVRVKLALSLDGRTALAGGDSQWISSDASRQDVQAWRARSSAVMTGIGTVLADDPSLNVRIGDQQRQPLRLIVDSAWRTPAQAKTLQLPGEVVIAGCASNEVPGSLRSGSVKLLALGEDPQGRVDLHELMAALAAMEINELQLESGAALGGALLNEALVDELLVYQAPVILGSGARDAFATRVLDDMQDRIELNCIESIRTGPDLRSIFRFTEHVS
ncbi:MAG: bifunctional diaminohydroxyphosphoribosylaminopyrimidine deaminase/5-amino-6-(5-phosphoribosylamino)uracil reductase RibD [Xanthomonadales bacterium]|nr:bifunctional diaminohydroxyphosphoribosylaminopyrimidine deaminase/5-amino-6-(5-phosphoribosylamino)uracil reductase RibD [Xanthomonadales bacterium]